MKSAISTLRPLRRPKHTRAASDEAQLTASLDRQHTIAASAFDKIELWDQASLALERFREVPFDFPVAEGSFARQVLSGGVQLRIVEAPAP